MERRENQGQRAERDNKRPNSRPKFNRERREEADDLQKKLVCINRVTKVVKGGRTMRFTALVVVGDGKGKVGCGTGKAAEVPQTTWFFSSCGGILELRRGIQAASCVGPD